MYFVPKKVVKQGEESGYDCLFLVKAKCSFIKSVTYPGVTLKLRWKLLDPNAVLI